MSEPSAGGEDELPRYLSQLRELTRGVLSDRLVGMYVVGSTAQGDRTATSDVDVLVVSAPMARPRWPSALAAAVVAAAEQAPVGRTEYVVYDDTAVRRPRYPLPYRLNVNAGRHIRRHVSTGGDPPHWFLLDVAMARMHADPLHGPSADVLIGVPPMEAVARAIVAALDWHQDDPDAAHGDAVLNACRSWRFLDGPGWASKTDAGRWAAERWDGDLIDDALLARRHGERWVEPSELARLLDHVRGLALRRVSDG